jgi:glycosyltransferase involved in cell wall biosynthesis
MLIITHRREAIVKTGRWSTGPGPTASSVALQIGDTRAALRSRHSFVTNYTTAQMPNAPAISVLMAVHNGEKFLAEAVESILNQTFRDLEFLIVDDGSVDSSPAMLKAYAARDPRVRLTLQQEKHGLTKALNAIFQLARGEFIARFDSDDIALPERFDRQISALRADPNLVLIGSEVELITDDGLTLGVRGHATNHLEIRKRLLLGDGSALTHPAVMMRQSSLRAIGGYDESFPVGQDLDLFLRLSEIGKVSNLPETLLLWRQHDCSINNTRSDLWMQLKRRAIESTIKRIGAAEYANALFYQTEKLWPSSDPLELGRFAELRGRYRAATKLYVRSIRRSTTRRRAVGRLLALPTIILRNLLRRYFDLRR